MLKNILKILKNFFKMFSNETEKMAIDTQDNEKSKKYFKKLIILLSQFIMCLVTVVTIASPKLGFEFNSMIIYVAIATAGLIVSKNNKLDALAKFADFLLKLFGK